MRYKCVRMMIATISLDLRLLFRCICFVWQPAISKVDQRNEWVSGSTQL